MPETSPSTAKANRPLLDMTLVVASVLMLAVALSWWLKQDVNSEPIGGLTPGKTAPEIIVDGWINGTEQETQDLDGKVIVVDAWFPACPNCWREAPELIKTYDAFRERGVVFIGLTYEPTEELPKIQNYIDKTGIKWPNGYGALQTLIGFEADSFPAYWVIGRDGKVVWNRDSDGELADGIELALSAE